MSGTAPPVIENGLYVIYAPTILDDSSATIPL